MYVAHFAASLQTPIWGRSALMMACNLPSSSSGQRAVAHGSASALVAPKID
jgi:hypothetical protein